MNLDDIRQDIDLIDDQLIHLLEKRMTLVHDVAQFKKMTGMKVLDNNREMAILNKVEKLTSQPELAPSLVNIFKDIMKHSRAYQGKQL